MRRIRALAVAAGVLFGSLAIGADPAPSAAAPSSSRSITAKRIFVDADGTRHVASTNKISMSVSQTTNLRGRQEVDVRWSGAHPTGGTVSDVNAAEGATQEYPFVILQCRGVDSTSVPASERIRPETCWTQTWSERYQGDSTRYPAWRSDLRAPADERTTSVKAPDPRPAGCFRAPASERFVPMVAANGTVYAGGSVGCAGQAPETANVGGSGLPSNATYGITGKDGTGSAQFGVWTTDENTTLGCTNTVACTLVAIPIVGVSCDAYGTALPEEDRPTPFGGQVGDTNCRAPAAYGAGDIAVAGARPTLAVSGSLWWSASNWDNRMTVPLSFAVSPNICSIVSNRAPLLAYGSILMNEATAQWQPEFCTSRTLYPFTHVQTAESAARSLLTNGTIDVAFGSRPPDVANARPTVQAPVAFTGWAVTFAIDDAKGNRVTSLRLDARLIAKLLTQSYPGASIVRNNYPALSGNPMNITKDPEFIALNPGLPEYTSLEAASTAMLLSTEADLIYALSEYLDEDPEARAWLDGTPDPWGMVVNPNYKRIELPVESWPVLDSFQLPDSYIKGQVNPCYSYSPSPYLSLIANPPGFISTVVQDVQYAISNVNIGCNGDPNDTTTLRLRTQGRQQPGYRFVLGVVPVSAAERYGLSVASLQTRSTVRAGSRFTSASGRTFVKPDGAGLKAAGALLKADADARTWSLAYSKFHDEAGSRGYPGAMPVFADVPTNGLDKQTAARAAGLLRFAGGTGQRAGTANGELPPGYLPLTAANGLGALSAYTLRAADAVAAQRGDVPELVAPGTGKAAARSRSTGSTDTTSDGSGGGGPVAGGAALPSTSALPSAATAGPNPGSTPSPRASSVAAAALRTKTAGPYSRIGGLVMPVVLGLALAAGLAATGLRYASWWPHLAASGRTVVTRIKGGAQR